MLVDKVYDVTGYVSWLFFFPLFWVVLDNSLFALYTYSLLEVLEIPFFPFFFSLLERRVKVIVVDGNHDVLFGLYRLEQKPSWLLIN